MSSACMKNYMCEIYNFLPWNCPPMIIHILDTNVTYISNIFRTCIINVFQSNEFLSKFIFYILHIFLFYGGVNEIS